MNIFTSDVIIYIKKLGLEDPFEIDEFVSDINNLRGNEWLDEIKKVCTEEEIAEFKELAWIDDEEDEGEE